MYKYKEKSKDFVIDKILEKVPKEVLQGQICEELFQRDYTTIEEVIKEYKENNRRSSKNTKSARNTKSVRNAKSAGNTKTTKKYKTAKK